MRMQHCWAGNHDRLVDDFPTRRAKRCRGCTEERQAKAKCKACGGPSGLTVVGKPRAYCDAAGCQHVMHVRSREGTAKPLPRTKVCASCRKRKRLNVSNFSPELRDDDGKVRRYSSWCKPCRSAYWRDRLATDPELRARNQARVAEHYERMMARRAVDPAYDEECRRVARARRRRRRRPQDDPDPEPLVATGAELPIAPLVPLIVEWLSRRPDDETLGASCALLGISDRRWYDYEHGRQHVARESTIDKMLIGADLLWWEVWPPEQWPLVAEVFEGTRKSLPREGLVAA